MVRACTPSARVSRAGPEWRSMICARTPRRASWLASIRPVGPAPTTRTSVSITSGARAPHVVHRHGAAHAAHAHLARGAEGELGRIAHRVAHGLGDHDGLLGDAAEARGEVHGLADDRVVEVVA